MPGLGGILGGARRLGTAFGQILIDTSGAEQAQMTMRRVGQNIGNAFSQIGRNARTFSAEIAEVNRELTVLGITGGLIVGLGIRTAASFEEAGVMLTGMVGSLGKANELVEQLRKRAMAAGVPFTDFLEASRILLPSLERNTEELQTWLDLSRRVAVLNPAQGIAGAAFAINEAMASGGTNFISLANRFNVSRKLLQEAMKETGGDFAQALDIVLTKMGITQSTAEAMGRTFNASFRAAKDAALQLLGEGFEPLLKALTPILSQTAQWLGQLRESAPLVATLGAALATLAAVGAPSLLMLNQVALALQRINKLKIVAKLGGLGGILKAGAGIAGKGAVLGGAAYVGARIGVGLMQGVGRATGNERLQEASLQQATTTLKQLLLVAANIVASAFGGIAKVLRTATAWLTQGFASVVETLGHFIQRLLDLIPGKEQFGPLAGIRKLSEDMLRGAEEMRNWANAEEWTADVDENRRKLIEGIAKFLGVFPQAAEDLAAGARAAGEAARFTPEQEEAILDWGTAVQEIERDANKQRLEATQAYEQQRSDVIASYEQTLVREAEDFARQRARQEAQLAKSIAGIRQEAAQRERKWQEDLNDKIADLKQDGNERIAEIEEEGQRNLEKMRSDHRLRLMEAAANLDARAVAEEQRRYQEQIAEAEESQRERVDKERENLQERIDAEREAHQERLQDARAADAQRIIDMQNALAEQQALEDEDRKIRLDRMAEDHQAQLDAMALAQQARLEQIVQGAIEEKNAIWDGLLERLDDLGLHNNAWLALQEDRQKASLALFDTYWKAFNARMTAPSSYGSTSTTTGGTTTTASRPAITPARYDPILKQWISGPMLTRQAGGPVYDTAAAMLHGSRSRPEYVLSAETTSLLRGALGGAFSQRQLVGAVGGGRSVTIQSGAISMPIYAAPGQSPADIAHQVEQVLVSFFKRYGG